jgi:dihydroorotase/N-acyl-D-amino-acid deacylase
VLRERRRPATPAQAADLVVEIVRKGGCSAVYHVISEEDLVRIMKHAATMVASDAVPGIPTFGKDVPHPRAYGTFARVLGVYVREKHVAGPEHLPHPACADRREDLVDAKPGAGGQGHVGRV